MGWGVGVGEVLHIYGTNTPHKDMRNSYQYTGGLQIFTAIQSQLHVEGAPKKYRFGIQ